MKMFVKNILAAAALVAVIGANTVDCAKVATAAAGGFGEDPNKNFNNIDLINKKQGKKRKKNDQESTMTTIAKLEEEFDIADGELVTLLSTEENKTKLGSKALGKLKPGSRVNRVIATIIWQESQNDEFKNGFETFYEEKQADNKKRRVLLNSSIVYDKTENIGIIDLDLEAAKDKAVNNQTIAIIEKQEPEQKIINNQAIAIIEKPEQKPEQKPETEQQKKQREDLTKAVVEEFKKYMQGKEVLFEMFGFELKLHPNAVRSITRAFEHTGIAVVVAETVKKGVTVNATNFKEYFNEFIFSKAYIAFLKWGCYAWNYRLTEEQKKKIIEANEPGDNDGFFDLMHSFLNWALGNIKNFVFDVFKK